MSFEFYDTPEARSLGFEEAYRDHYGQMVGLANRQGAGEDSEDVAQEAMIRLWRQGENFDYREGGGTYRWLTLVTGRIMVDRYRASQSRPLISDKELDPETFPAEDPFETADNHSLVQQALGHMSKPQKEAVVLTRLLDFSIAETADKLDIAEGTVKSRIWYGLRAASDGFARDQITFED